MRSAEKVQLGGGLGRFGPGPSSVLRASGWCSGRAVLPVDAAELPNGGCKALHMIGAESRLSERHGTHHVFSKMVGLARVLSRSSAQLTVTRPR